MNITLEQIDILRKRANVSYKEAKDALEKNNGNMVEALTYLEEQNRIKPEGIKIGDSSFINSIKHFFSFSNIDRNFYLPRVLNNININYYHPS